MRLRLVKNLILLFIIILIACLWYLQCLKVEEYSLMSQKNRIRIVPLAATRGNIYDKNMNLLASSRIEFDCAVIPQEFSMEDEQLKQLSSLLAISKDSIRENIKKNRIAPFAPLTLKRGIGKELAITISEKIIDLPGVIIQTYPARYYPYGPSCAHITGYVGKISEKELGRLRDYGYKMKDVVGRGGLELYYDDYLKGETGGMQTEVDSRGRELRVLGIKEPSSGRNIQTTIDLDLQIYTSSLMEGYKGAVIVMDAVNGEVITIVSKPDFDPNIFVNPGNSREIRKLLERKDYPFINRGISATYAPGSVFKIVTATAALESGSIDAGDHLNCIGYYILGGRRFHCWKKSGHGSQRIDEAIKNSCNVFFYQLGLKTGVDSLTDFCYRYDLNRVTNIDLPYEKSGTVPGRLWKRRFMKEQWYQGDTLNFSIGQGYLLLTPIGILKLYNTLANEGEIINPYLVKKIDSIDVFNLEKRRMNVSPANLKIIKRGTKMAVNDEHGTAGNAAVDGFDIAGKTGTAQTSTQYNHAWFVGFSPVDKPKISIVVFVEHGGKGSDVPCKIVSKLFKRLKELEYL